MRTLFEALKIYVGEKYEKFQKWLKEKGTWAIG